MSHFTVLIIGDSIDNQLAPFQENNMGDCPKEFLKFYSEKDEKFKENPDIINGVEEEGYYDNPNAKWDWYILGGRWSGMIKLKEGATGVAGRSGVFKNETGIDSAKKGDILNLHEIKTYAILKDGEWYARGEMGWFGVSNDSLSIEEWDKKYIELLTGLPDDILLSIVDCHI